MECSRVEIITSNAKIETLRSAMGSYGITGMTVFQVMGCGVQYGTPEYESEQRAEPTLLPKQMVMLILPKADVPGFLKFVSEELYTGHIGDGKIFVSDVENVIRVRTGEEGYDALIPQAH
ncbi:Nitrogen regulatory protein PII [Eubacterium aggregans]|uniref:Nitrogen regulatory protein PII n=1 Tax=Eubacterium aggregans TaxID=81409 RepID=A0A1H4E8P0_9FIRM|nr:P-II family nitrogen regulator [Eubacterium aggregans]SEA81421.1 Nitrogen regulatory protein PII [Eubacterium aggregans]